MSTVKTTSRGQVTLRKEVFEHLGARPGSEIEVELIPGGKVSLASKLKPLTVNDLVGMFKCKGNGTRLTIDEINDAIAEGYVRGALAE